jgi:hypothetical protein
MDQAEGTGAERCIRRWRSVAEKRRIVERILVPSASVALVVRAHRVAIDPDASVVEGEVGWVDRVTDVDSRVLGAGPRSRLRRYQPTHSVRCDRCDMDMTANAVAGVVGQTSATFYIRLDQPFAVGQRRTWVDLTR